MTRLKTSSIFAVIALIFMSAAGTAGQTNANTYGPDDLDTNRVSTDDGPHVFWQNDTTAVVFYYCDSAVVSETFVVADTLRFTGFCHDSAKSYTIAVQPRPIMTASVDGISRFLAVSDIHGEYNHLVTILTEAGVIDGRRRWNWGDGHLVIVGDVMDRGTAVTECLWLIYRLEREAAAQGGAVHMLLGNHELIVLRGDLRYVHERYTEGIAYRSRFPYDQLFGPDTELGRWLRTRPTLFRLNNTLFIHGGATPDLLQTYGSIDSLNTAIRSGLDFSAPQLFFSPEIKLLYSGYGPLWYRGYIYGLEGRYEAATTEQIDSILALTGTNQIVVGHSEQDSIGSYHDGRVIAIDVDVETLGGFEALLHESNRWFRVTASGARVPLDGVKP